MTATVLQTVRVFVSSTWMDLQPERKAVEAALQRFRETKFVGMEYFGSRSEATSAASLVEVDGSDVCVVIVGGRYGSGITEQEYRRAQERHLPCFVYVKSEPEPAGAAGEGRQQRDDFLAALSRHTVSEFGSPEDLAAKVTADLHRWLFDEYLIPRLERALQVEAGRTELETLLVSVRDITSLGKELLGRLRVAGVTPGLAEVKVVLTAAEVEERANLAVLRDRVKQWWISGILEQSVHGEIMLELRKTRMSEAIDHPWHAVFENADRPPTTLAPGTRTVDLFAQASGFFLILGEPGAGKTVMLLELARDLIAAVEADPSKPVPIVLNLSSWGSRRLPLRAWIAEELKLRYYVAPATAASWLARGRLLPLLDGMDEVAAEHRRGCVDAINHFVRETPPPGLAVCVRREEYSRIGVKLSLQAAVYIQPLTVEQADNYLAATGRDLTGLRAALREDAALQEMVQSPLMLSILALTYRESSRGEMSRTGGDTLEARRDQVFNAYVDRMFERRGKSAVFDRMSVMRGLSWLARQMQRHSQTIFTLEQLQPSWCANRGERWA